MPPVTKLMTNPNHLRNNDFPVFCFIRDLKDLFDININFKIYERCLVINENLEVDIN